MDTQALTINKRLPVGLTQTQMDALKLYMELTETPFEVVLSQALQDHIDAVITARLSRFDKFPKA